MTERWQDGVPEDWFGGPECDDEQIQARRCRELWLSVIERQMSDASLESGDRVGLMKHAANDARRYVTSNSRDIEMVCDYVGVNPAAFVAKVRELLKDADKTRELSKRVAKVRGLLNDADKTRELSKRVNPKFPASCRHVARFS